LQLLVAPLPRIPVTSERLRALLAESNEALAHDARDAARLAAEATALATENSDTGARARARYLEGRAAELALDETRALEAYRESLAGFQAVRDDIGRADALRGIGQVYDTLGDAPQALAHHLRALAIAEEAGDLRSQAAAMRTIGISPIEALVIPRILACTFMMVVLGFYASVMAIIGGAVIGDLMLGIPFLSFLMRIQEVVPVHDLWVGLIKAPVFGFIIALAGCFQGMLVEGDSEQVGQRTTTAVVQSIFLVIVLDAVFAVFFSSVGWI